MKNSRLSQNSAFNSAFYGYPGFWTKLPAIIAIYFALTVASSLAAPGDLDTSFDPGSGFQGNVKAVVLQSDGKLVVGGLFQPNATNLAGPSVFRLNPDGSLDQSFKP